MTPRLFLKAAARREIAEGFRWYEERSPGLGSEFLRAVRATLAQIAREPELYSFAVDDIRKAPLHRFPYVAYYVVLPRGISVLAVIHGRRHPRRWQSRR